MTSGRRAAITAAVASGTAVFAAISVLMYRSMKKYGCKGTMRMIWEGDHLVPEIRQAADALEEVQLSISDQDTVLEKAETALDRTRLDSVDGGGEKDDEEALWNLVPQWILNYEGDLERDLYMTSQKLDSLAAKIDAVASHGDADVKVKKKLLSQQAVDMMGRADVLLKVYEALDSTETEI